MGLDTVGREAVELSKSGNLAVYAALWFTGALKVAGGLLALALAQPWGGRVFRRWMLLAAGWTATVLLVLYGGANIAVLLLVEARVVDAPADLDWRGLHGHLYLWDPWFLGWGVLLGIATLAYTRGPHRSEADRGPGG